MPRYDAVRMAALQHFDQQLRGMTLAELQQLSSSLQIFSRDDAKAQILARHLVRAGRPDPRRARRDDEVTYRLDVQLQGLEPPVWRRLDVSSWLMLDDVHRILQAALGFTDSHLHRFAVGPSVHDDASAVYLCPWEFDDGEIEGGVDEREVRLDELLAEPGDRMLYAYDFGDSWEFTLTLVEVADRSPGEPAAALVDGRRAGPPEDSGGVGHYEELVESGEVARTLDREATADAVRRALERQPRLPPLVQQFFDMLQVSDVGDELYDLALSLDLREAPTIETDVAEQLVTRVRWLVQRLGADGVQLTSAGYLPPTLVQAVMDELQLDPGRIGRANREDLTYPVAAFRRAAQELGVVRKVKGRLTVPVKVRTASGDPLKMWWQLVDRFPLGRYASVERFVAVLTLLWLAAGRSPSSAGFQGAAVRALDAAGWRHRDRRRLDRGDLLDLVRPLDAVLDAVNCASPPVPGRPGLRAAPHAQLFARAVLATRAT